MSRQVAERVIRSKLANVVNARSEALRTEIFDVLERNRVGRGTFWPGNRVPSSAPGDPPARQTGRLMESIRVLSRATPRTLVSEVGPDPKVFPDAYYAALLEFGTSRMAARPYMRPALQTFKRKNRR